MSDNFTPVQIINWAYSTSPVLSFLGKAKRRAWDDSGTKRLALSYFNADGNKQDILENLPFFVWVDEWMEAFVRYKKAHRSMNLKSKKAYLCMQERIETQIFNSMPNSFLGVLCKLIVWQEKAEFRELFVKMLYSETEMLSRIALDLQHLSRLSSQVGNNSQSTEKIILEGHFLSKIDLKSIKSDKRRDEIHPFLYSEGFSARPIK